MYFIERRVRGLKVMSTINKDLSILVSKCAPDIKALSSAARVASALADNRLNDNFETALSALIEYHGANALTSLAAVMRHYDLGITCQYEDGSWVADEDIVIVQDDESGNVSKIFVCQDSIVWAETLSANNIKPEEL